MAMSVKSGWITDKNGVKKHYKNYWIHNDDGPAVIFPNGEKRWYQSGNLHRIDGPAIESPDGTVLWFINGELK